MMQAHHILACLCGAEEPTLRTQDTRGCRGVDGSDFSISIKPPRRDYEIGLSFT